MTRRPFDPSPARLPARDADPERSTSWDLTVDLPRLGRVDGAATGSSRRRSRRSSAFQGTLASGAADRCSRRSARWTRWARSAIASGTTRRCSTTRISATTRSTPGASRCRSCSRASSRPARGSTRSCWPIPLETHPRVDGRRTPSWPSTASRSRACSTSRSTCSTSRASGCCRIAGRFNSVPHDSYAALTTADMKFPSITLSSGEQVTLTYGQYRALLETNRRQEDRAAAYRAFHQSLRRQPEHLRGAVQRRAAARLVSRAGARLRDARSTPRCTATTSRPRSSRT